MPITILILFMLWFVATMITVNGVWIFIKELYDEVKGNTLDMDNWKEYLFIVLNMAVIITLAFLWLGTFVIFIKTYYFG